MGREPGIGPAQLTCPNTDTDHSDQGVPVLFAPLFLEGRPAVGRQEGAGVAGDGQRAGDGVAVELHPAVLPVMLPGPVSLLPAPAGP